MVAEQPRIVFVTGISGAGKTQALKIFGDLGYYCVDNIPPALVPQLLELLKSAGMGSAAIGLDLRSGGLLGEPAQLLDELKQRGAPDILFLDAGDETIVQRYSETRHRHPLGEEGRLLEAIAVERESIEALRRRASTVLDTSSLTVQQLKKRLSALYSANGTLFALTVVAFGFKFGLPLDLDLLFDVRFLRNPNYVAELRPLTGRDAPVAQYIEGDPNLEPLMRHLGSFLEFLVPRYRDEGKAQLTIGIGCTGGRHRSLYVAERLCESLESKEALHATLVARDLTRS